MSILPIQTQAFLLYGSGSVVGDVTLNLSSFKDIDGNNIAMQGTVMTGTIEPNSGSSEEQISFTGVTQNANGTATLTGVSSVSWGSPYTVTSGLVKSHAGNTTFVLSDTAYLYSQYAALGNTQTFTGTDTFSISPIIPTVSSSQTTQAASVGYVNAVSISGAAKASNTVFGITELTVAAATASVPLAVGDNDPRMAYVTASESLALAAVGQGNIDNTNYYVSQRGAQIGSESYALTTGASNAYAIALSPVPAGYVAGERIYFKAHAASGTSPTINKNGIGAKSLYKQITTGTTPLTIGDIGTNQMCVAEYDGGAYQLLSPIAKTSLTNVPIYNCGSTSKDAADSSTTQNIAHGLGKVPAFIRVKCVTNIATSPGGVYSAESTYNGTTQANNSVYVTGNFGTTADGTFTLNTSGTSGTQRGSITFDSTNIIIVWTKTNSPTGVYQILWEAISPTS